MPQSLYPLRDVWIFKSHDISFYTDHSAGPSTQPLYSSPPFFVRSHLFGYYKSLLARQNTSEPYPSLSLFALSGIHFVTRLINCFRPHPYVSYTNPSTFHCRHYVRIISLLARFSSFALYRVPDYFGAARGVVQYHSFEFRRALFVIFHRCPRCFARARRTVRSGVTSL